MGKIPKPSGGSTAALNFFVVGRETKPTTPKENMIWVSTSVDITSWEFGYTAPANPVPGMVWFTIAASGRVALNALKKNGIQLFPVRASQYVSGAWQAVPVQIWQNGAWSDWQVFFFLDGDECEGITGGWRGVLGSSSALAKGSYSNADGVIALSVTGSQAIWAATENMIDLTDYNTLTINVESRNSGGTCYFGVSQKTTFNSSADLAASISIAKEATGPMELDISGLSGEYYICVRLASSTSGTYVMSFSEVYPE